MKKLCWMVLPALMGSAQAADLLTIKGLAERLNSDQAPVIIDVRGEGPYLQSHIPSAVMIPYDHIGKHVDLLYDRKKEPMLLYGNTERDARSAADALEEAGFKRVMILVGGFQAWQAAGGALTDPIPATPAPSADRDATTSAPPSTAVED
ncbi:sulfurtransferase (plasmid) [Alcanivorax sp. N3-2A]|nr:sulfurtransferase [Alcanivorax sp. N3-2A]ASK36884.1 sulfurtransferase [Alcanivorax sp. N3-2A]